VTTCGPAFTGTRTRRRASTASPVSVGFWNNASRSSAPPTCAMSTRSPSTANSNLMGGFEPAHDVEICAVQPGLKHIFAVEREIVADPRCLQWFRAAILRCADPAKRPA